MPGRAILDRDPRERGLEQVHVRVGTLRNAPDPILEEATERVSIRVLERVSQRYGLFTPTRCLAERAVAARISEEGEGLVVEIETRIAHNPIKTDYGHDRRIRGDEVLAKIIQRMALGLAPGATPAEPSGFTVRECLPGDHPCAVRPSQRLAVQRDCLVKAAANAIRTLFPP